MMTRMRMERIALLFIVVLVILFIVTAGLKILDPALFARQVKYYKILPLSLVNVVSLIIPWWELAGVVGLLRSKWRMAGAWIILGMTLLFTAAVISALVRGLDVACGCFGSAGGTVGVMTLAIDLVVLLMAGVIIVGCRPPSPEKFVVEEG